MFFGSIIAGIFVPVQYFGILLAIVLVTQVQMKNGNHLSPVNVGKKTFYMLSVYIYIYIYIYVYIYI